jgi:hypothetical protein
MKAIDRNAIRKLAIMTSLANYIQTGNSDDIKLESDFIWALRDCFLEEKETDKGYLEIALNEDAPSINRSFKEIEEINIVRKSIKTKFKTRTCFRLPIPVERQTSSCGILCNNKKVEQTQEDLLQKLDKVSYEQLRKQFKDKMEKMCSYIKDKVAIKIVEGKPLNGSLFIEYLKDIIVKLNNNEKILLSESLTVGIKMIAHQTLEAAQKLFVKLFDDYIQQNKLPIIWDKFGIDQQKIIKQCYDYVKENVIGSDSIIQEFTSKLTEFIFENSKDSTNPEKGKLSFYRKINSKEIYGYNKTILQEKWALMMKSKLTYKPDQKPITIEEFESELTKLEDFYNTNAILGPEKKTVREDFFQTIDIETIKINIKNIKEKFEAEENLKKNLAENFEKTRILNKEEKLQLENQINSLGKDLLEMQLELKKKIDLVNDQSSENFKLKNREIELEEMLKASEKEKSILIEQQRSKICTIL